MVTPTPRVSLIIPTYHRPASLQRALQSLLGQTFTPFEAIVVDNGVDPKVAALVDRFASACPFALRYVPQPELGLHNARHAGARAAKADLLVFTDDDATFCPNWLAAYDNAFTHHPDLAAAGGPVEAAFEHPPPHWLLDDMRGKPAYPLLSLMDLGSADQQGPELFFYGVNMAVRRAVLFDVGGFNPDSVGKLRVGDGETGLQRAIVAAGMDIGYVAQARTTHHIPPGRTTLQYFRRRRGFDGGHLLYLHIRRSPLPPARLRMLRHCGGIILRQWPLWLSALICRGSTDPTSLEKIGLAAMSYGRLRYAFRLVWDARLRDLVTRKRWLDTAEKDNTPGS